MSSPEQRSNEGPAAYAEQPGQEQGSSKSKRSMPANLPAFLRSDFPLNAYVNALTKSASVTQRPTEADRAEALQIINDDLSLLPKFADLTRSIIEKSHSSILTDSIRTLAFQLIRQDEDLSDWGRNAGYTADTEIGRLARRVKDARGREDKEAVKAAEQKLRLGLCLVCMRSDFDALAILAEINANLDPTARTERVKDLQERVGKEIANASVKNLESFGLITATVTSQLVELRRQFSLANERINQLTERDRMQRDQILEQRSKIERMGEECSQMAAALSMAQGQIKGTEGAMDHELNSLRARFRSFLTNNMSELVSQSHEALTSNPPAPDIAEVLLEDARDDIKKELIWLNKHLSSD